MNIHHHCEENNLLCVCLNLVFKPFKGLVCSGFNKASSFVLGENQVMPLINKPVSGQREAAMDRYCITSYSECRSRHA